MNTKLKYIAPVLLAASFGSAQAATIIAVANASFESQTLADGVTNTTITDWVTNDARTFVVNPDASEIQAPDGNNAVELKNSTLTQSLSGFTINSGDTITVTFDVWEVNGGNFQVNFGGLGFEAVSLDLNDTIYSKSVEFTATSTITTADLVFNSITGGRPHRIDDVAVSFTAVPEPSSSALLGLGGLALILRRRKG